MKDRMGLEKEGLRYLFSGTESFTKSAVSFRKGSRLYG